MQCYRIAQSVITWFIIPSCIYSVYDWCTIN